MTTMAELDGYREAIAGMVGDRLVSDGRALYGTSFALDHGPDERLADLLPVLDDVSLAYLVREARAGRLAGKMAVDAAAA